MTAESETSSEVRLRAHNGSEPHPVRPTPTFHGRQIPMRTGFVDVDHINLWGDNERLTIHVKQFEKASGRTPTSSELLDIMRSEANLAVPGLDGKDQFRIQALAASIAVNGVRVPPVIAIDGTLLDGNRRVAACLHVLHDSNFSHEEKGPREDHSCLAADRGCGAGRRQRCRRFTQLSGRPQRGVAGVCQGQEGIRGVACPLRTIP